MSEELHQILAILQTTLLPTEHMGAFVEIAATHVPASEVGGDYYDVINVGGTTWLAIGDVVGHGLRSALIMLMAQASVSALVRLSPSPSPSYVLELTNRVLWENVRQRLSSDDHMTCTLLRCDPDGSVTYAGAHEDLVIWRAATGTCEQLATPGTWLAAIDDIAGKNTDRMFHLAPGDVLVLYTDGVTEARDAARKQFGIDRLTAVVTARATEPLREIRDAIFEAVEGFRVHQDDDVTVVVAAYR
jgi:sigma-B regulation protein RsbU (phosphoserine phosphatase)